MMHFAIIALCNKSFVLFISAGSSREAMVHGCIMQQQAIFNYYFFLFIYQDVKLQTCSARFLNKRPESQRTILLTEIKKEFNMSNRINFIEKVFAAVAYAQCGCYDVALELSGWSEGVKSDVHFGGISVNPA